MANEKFQKIKSTFFNGCVILLITISCIFFWNIFMRMSGFSWTVQQPEYWDAVVKMVLVAYIYGLILSVPLKNELLRISFIAAVFLFISFQYSFFVATLVTALYALFIYVTGYTISRLIRTGNEALIAEPHFLFSLGISGVICFVGLLSALKIGTPEKLRMIFPIIFVIELFFSYKHLGLICKKIFTYGISVQPNYKHSHINNIFVAVILTTITIAIAQANISYESDSLWYGLQSHKVLAPETGIYDKVTLLAIVHTYAKGIEALTLVFGGLSTYGYTYGVNILLGILTLCCAYRIGKYFFSKSAGIIFAFLIALTPAIMNMLITAKSDIASLYLQITALYFMTKAIDTKSGSYFLGTISLLILSVVFKPSSFIFSGFLALIFIIFAIFSRIKISIRNFSVVIFPVMAVLFLFARTYFLTGYPIARPMDGIFRALGMTTKYPYLIHSTGMISLEELLSTMLVERIARLPKLFFAPYSSDIVTTEINWWGPLGSVVGISMLGYIVLNPIKTFNRAKTDIHYALALLLFLGLGAASIGTLLIMERPDGNYYMLFLVIEYWFAVYHWFKPYSEKSTVISGFASILFIANFLLYIATSPAWILGLTPVDWSNKGYYNHEKLHIKETFIQRDMYDIFLYLTENPSNKIITFTMSECTNILPCAAEPDSDLKIWGAHVFESADAFHRYMLVSETEHLLLQDDYLATNEWFISYLKDLAAQNTLCVEYVANAHTLIRVGQTGAFSDEESAVVMQYLENLTNTAVS